MPWTGGITFAHTFGHYPMVFRLTGDDTRIYLTKDRGGRMARRPQPVAWRVRRLSQGARQGQGRSRSCEGPQVVANARAAAPGLLPARQAEPERDAVRVPRPWHRRGRQTDPRLPPGTIRSAHMRRCCEWTVYMLTEHPHTMSFIASEHWKPTRKGTIEHDGPAPGTMTAVPLPTNGINAYESGFGIRTGWAGRSH